MSSCMEIVAAGDDDEGLPDLLREGDEVVGDGMQIDGLEGALALPARRRPRWDPQSLNLAAYARSVRAKTIAELRLVVVLPSDSSALVNIMVCGACCGVEKSRAVRSVLVHHWSETSWSLTSPPS